MYKLKMKVDRARTRAKSKAKTIHVNGYDRICYSLNNIRLDVRLVNLEQMALRLHKSCNKIKMNREQKRTLGNIIKLLEDI